MSQKVKKKNNKFKKYIYIHKLSKIMVNKSVFCLLLYGGNFKYSVQGKMFGFHCFTILKTGYSYLVFLCLGKSDVQPFMLNHKGLFLSSTSTKPFSIWNYPILSV